MEDLAHIVTFARVVKAGSFAAAARHLNVTDSVASKHIAKLEQTLGVRLLNRSTRKLSLTEAGATYYAHCARIVEEMENSRRALAELQAVPRGKLRVTAPVPVAMRLGTMLSDFLKRYPKIQLELDASNRVVDLAEEGFDVAIRAARNPLPPNIVARLLRSMDLYLCAAPQYLERHGVPQHPNDLARHNCVSLSPDLREESWQFGRGDEHVTVPVHGSLQSNMPETLLDLVLAGNGITLLPRDMSGPHLRDGRLVPVLADWTVETRANIYAVYLPTKHLAPKVRVFVDFLVAQFAGAA